MHQNLFINYLNKYSELNIIHNISFLLKSKGYKQTQQQLEQLNMDIYNTSDNFSKSYELTEDQLISEASEYILYKIGRLYFQYTKYNQITLLHRLTYK